MHGEADRRIDIATDMNATHLDLSDLDLTEVPERVGLLTNLITLDLGYNRISALPDFIGQLASLRSLNLPGNKLVDLPAGFARLSRLTRLQLHSNRFTTVPEVLRGLTQLERLVLGGNQLKSLPEFVCGLIRLNSLDLYGNQLTRLPDEIARLSGLTHLDLGANHLGALPESLGSCTGLTRLDVSGNELRELPSGLGALARLTHLDLSGNRLAALPDAIGELNSLTHLDLYGNVLGGLPEGIVRLSRLAHLDLSDNRLAALPDAIGELTNLVVLNLRGNRLTGLPESLGDLVGLQILNLDGNSLPPEAEAAVAQDISAVLAYLRELVHKTVTVREAKLILIGEGAVGKSSLLASMRREAFVEDRPTTHGVEVKPVPLTTETGERLTLNAWDFGGQAAYRPTHQFFFSTPAVYLVAWNPRIGAAQGFVDYWIKLVRQRVGDDVRFHIVATHASLHGNLGEFDEARLRRDHGDCIAAFHRIDSKTGMGIADLKSALAATASELPHLKRRLPARWRDLLDALNRSEETHLTYADYLARAQAHGLDTDSARSLAGVATALGHWCFYPDIAGLDDLVVLGGDWLSLAVSLVLNDPETRDRGGLITHDRLSRLWDDPRRPDHERYPAHLHPALRLLMREYQLAYRVRDTGMRPTSLISQLVPTAEPPLHEWEQYGPSLPRQRYIIEFRDANRRAVIPEGLMYRLITWFHRFSLGRADHDYSLHWGSGLVLDDGNHGRALVRIEDDQLAVAVKAAYPTYLCKMISNDICNYVSDWKGLTPRILVPCGDQCAVPGRPDAGAMQFNLALLQQMKAEGEDETRCTECYKQMPIDAFIGELGIVSRPTPRTSDRDALAAIHSKLDAIETKITEQGTATRTHVSAELDLAAAGLWTQLEEQTQQYLQFFTDEAVNGPRLFTVERVDSGPRLRGIVKHRFRVVLWCEYSHLPVHLLDHDPEAGVYEIDLDRQWLVRARPWIALASRVLRLGVDFGPAILRLRLDDGEWKALEERFRLAETTLKEIATTASDFADRDDTGPSTGDVPVFDEPTRGQLRRLHALLEDKDPDFAGLRRVRDRNRFLWVHRDFAHHYD